MGRIMNDRLVKVVIMIVTLVWAANFLTPLWKQDYKPIPELNVAFMTIVGGLLLARGQGGGGADPPPDPPSNPSGVDPP
jgi:hypothetical protein